MTDQTQFRHALVLAPAEVRLASGAEQIQLVRTRGTSLRGKIALAEQEFAVVFATASLQAVVSAAELSPSAGSEGLFEWLITDVKILPKPLALGHGVVGPVWVRLGSPERAVLGGEEFPERHTPKPYVDRGLRGNGDTLAQVSEVALEDPAPVLAALNGFEEVQKSGIEREGASGEDTTALEAAVPVEHRPDEESEVIGGYEVAASSPAVEDPVTTQISEAQIQADKIERARVRAGSFIPPQEISEKIAREILHYLRDTEIKSTFPNVPANRSLLRKAMLDRLIEDPIETEGDFFDLIPLDMISGTDKDQISAYLGTVLQILKQII